MLLYILGLGPSIASALVLFYCACSVGRLFSSSLKAWLSSDPVVLIVTLGMSPMHVSHVARGPIRSVVFLSAQNERLNMAVWLTCILIVLFEWSCL